MTKYHKIVLCILLYSTSIGLVLSAAGANNRSGSHEKKVTVSSKTPSDGNPSAVLRK